MPLDLIKIEIGGLLVTDKFRIGRQAKSIKTGLRLLSTT